MLERKQVRSISEQELIKTMTPDDLRKAAEIIKFLAVHGEIVPDDAGFLLASAEPALQRLQKESQALQRQREQKRISRRQLFKRAGQYVLAVGAVSGFGGCSYTLIDNLWGGAAQQKEREKNRRLEESHTLGLESTSPSFSGWIVRYARKDQLLVPTNVTSDPLQVETWIQFPGTKLNQLERTGIILRDHVRSTDGVPVGKLAIATQFIPSTRSDYSDEINIGEEWVLRDKPTEDINANALIFENQAKGLNYYLSISRSKSINLQKPTFQLQAYRLETKQ